MKVKIILNPYANRWGAKRQMVAIKQAFTNAGVDFDIAVTEKRKEATMLAFEAAGEGYDAIVAAGGDGTINEVVNGLVQAAGEGVTCPLAVLPIGTGNDFNDMLGLPRDFDEIAAIVSAGKTRQIDLGRVNDHYFDNNCAVAMEPLVTIENAAMTKLSGNIRYIVALMKALIKLQAWDMKIKWDEGTYEGKVIVLSICNSPRTGGLFYMAPNAKLDDGFFDVVLIPEIPKRTIMAILPRLFKGTHIKHPAVRTFRTRHLTVESQPSTPIHADGEVISTGSEKIEYELIPGKLTMLMP